MSGVKRGRRSKRRRKSQAPKLLTAALMLLVALAIYYAWQQTHPSQSSPPSGEAAPPFTLTDIDGKTFSLEDFRGKIVILDFFFIRCPPCQEEVSHLTEVFRRYRGKVMIISISVDLNFDTTQRLQQFRREHQIEWIIARDTADVAGAYGVTAVPTLLVIDQDGRIRYRHIGLTPSTTLLREVEALLGEGG